MLGRLILYSKGANVNGKQWLNSTRINQDFKLIPRTDQAKRVASQENLIHKTKYRAVVSNAISERQRNSFFLKGVINLVIQNASACLLFPNKMQICPTTGYLTAEPCGYGSKQCLTSLHNAPVGKVSYS